MKNDRLTLTYEIEKAYEWRKWISLIPYVAWPAKWMIKAIPPICGAIIRYNIKHSDMPDSFVSVYLDCYDELGCVGYPYWEIYPVCDDCVRIPMEDVTGLLEAIQKSLDGQRKPGK